VINSKEGRLLDQRLEGHGSPDQQEIHNSPPGAATPSGFPHTPLPASREGVARDKDLEGHGSGPNRPGLARTDSTSVPPPPPGALKRAIGEHGSRPCSARACTFTS
jgi:hypothetical protein